MKKKILVAVTAVAFLLSLGNGANMMSYDSRKDFEDVPGILLPPQN